MLEFPVSVALGKSFSNTRDLAYVHVPDGVSKAEALEMVAAANLDKKLDPPYAFLVCEGPSSLEDPIRPEKSARQSISLREGQHVAVIYGKKPDIPSFHNTFQEIVSQSFPDDKPDNVSLRRISEFLASDLLVGIDGSPRTDGITDIIESCLAMVKDLYMQGHSGIRSWNSVWFLHCNAGIQNLYTILREENESGSRMTALEFFEEYAHAAFGFPRVTKLWAIRNSSSRDAKRFNDAREEYWNSSESIENSLRVLELREREGFTSLLALDWSEFDALLVDSPNPWLAFATFIGANPERVRAFTVLSEADFLSPGGEADREATLELIDQKGVNLALQPQEDASPVYVPMFKEKETGEFWSEPLCLIVPLVRSAGELEVLGNEVTVTVSPLSQGEWQRLTIARIPGGLAVRGRIGWKMGSGKNASRFRRLTLTAKFPSGTSVSPYLPQKPQSLVALTFDSAGSFFAAAPIKARGATGTFEYVGKWPDASGHNNEAMDLKSTTRGFLGIIWSETSQTAFFDRMKIPQHASSTRLSQIIFTPTGEHEIRSGENVFRISALEVESAQQSAILAAALKQQVSQNRPSSPMVDSIRGQYESYLSEVLSSTRDHEFVNALGHAAFAGDMQGTMEDLLPQDGGAILMSDHARMALRNQDFIHFEKIDFTSGPEAQRFRDAFRSLEVATTLNTKSGNDNAIFEWPSRISWQSLWQTDRLKEYLDSYVELVRMARSTGDSALLFWAAYPFSISVWDVENGSGCGSVLLSPLHPVRLAWLAGIEDVLSSANESLRFLGSVEGWNFPISGPGSGSGHRLLAVPSDSGEGQLFTSWSMMVKASTSDPTPLGAPISIGSYDAPGTAVSGLNAQAVEAALRSFRKMHPHITTLTVDLSAQKKQPRLTEIDDAVLKMAVNWKESQVDGLLGGVRVLDSVNRLGAPPRSNLTKLIRDIPELLFTWSRYNPRRVTDRACSVRFLQDSGSVIRASDSTKSLGVIGKFPLRRFDANDGLLSSSHANDSHPGVKAEYGWSPFTAALSAVESAPRISAGISRGSLGDQSANWTVMGETYLSPSTISSLMGSVQGGEQMLWEWRPPILEDRNHRALLERRPFVSIARVPRTFGKELNKLLNRARPEAATDQLRADVMTLLGSRGVGLSSLLAMGGTHVAGAVGFFLALSLFDRALDTNHNRLVIPIDAADYFLRLLADGSSPSESRRRADLLVIDLSDSNVTMTPVEIKAYGMQSQRPENRLPDVDSHDLDDALIQLRNSEEVLDKIVRTSSQVSGADAALWWNSFAALIEVAAKLSPKSIGNVDDFMARLSSVVDGRTELKLGQPILTYFLQSATTADGSKYYTGAVGGSNGAALGLVCDMNRAFEGLSEQDDGAMLDDWRRLVDLALDSRHAVAELSSRGKAPGSGDVTSTRVNPVGSVSGGLGSTEEHLRSTEAVPVARSWEDVGPDDLGATSESSHQLDPSHPHIAGMLETTESPATGGIFDQGVRLSIGTVVDSIGNAPVDFWPSNTGLNQPNIGIVGDLGTGKTELVKALIAQVREQVRIKQPGLPTSFLIFDYKGDFQGAEFLDRVGGTVLAPHRIPLNVFLPVTEEYSRKPFQQGASLVDTFKRIYSGIGPRQMSMLNQAVRESFQDGGKCPPTISDVRDKYLDLVPDADSVTSILDTFVFGEIFSTDKSKLRSFDDILDGNVVVVALNKLGQDANTKNSLVALFLNLYHDYMLRSELLPFEGTDPTLRYLKSFLLVDEAVNIMRYDFQVLEDIMLKGRGAGIGVILASQYLSHFRVGRTDYGQPLRTWFIHKVPSVSVRELVSLGMTGVTEELAQRVPALRNHEVLYKSFGWDRGEIVRVRPYYEVYGA